MAYKPDETQFYLLYRKALPPFDEDVLERSEPMEVRDYAELFSYTFRLIIENRVKNDEQQLKTIHEKFCQLAKNSADPNLSPREVITRLQEEMEELQIKEFRPQLIPLYEQINKCLSTAASSEVVFRMALQKKFPALDEDIMEKYILAFTKINHRINELGALLEKKPRDIEIEAKINLLSDLKEEFLNFASSSKMSLSDLIDHAMTFEEKKEYGTSLYKSRALFKSTSGHVLDETLAILNDIRSGGVEEKTPRME